MTEYHISWETDIDASNPFEAARIALSIQRDPNSIATVFLVTDQVTAHSQIIDLALFDWTRYEEENYVVPEPTDAELGIINRVFCPHGYASWFGNECGRCEDEGLPPVNLQPTEGS